MAQRQLIEALNFASITSILGWSGSNEPYYLDNCIVYVLRDGMYWYFGQKENDYSLICVSEKDLGDMK